MSSLAFENNIVLLQTHFVVFANVCVNVYFTSVALEMMTCLFMKCHAPVTQFSDSLVVREAIGMLT